MKGFDPQVLSIHSKNSSISQSHLYSSAIPEGGIEKILVETSEELMFCLQCLIFRCFFENDATLLTSFAKNVLWRFLIITTQSPVGSVAAYLRGLSDGASNIIDNRRKNELKSVSLMVIIAASIIAQNKLHKGKGPLHSIAYR